MANERPPNDSSHGDAGKSALERYLSKQKAERAAQAAKEAASKPAKSTLGLRAALGKATAGTPSKSTLSQNAPKPSLSGIERPVTNEPPQPASLRRWESLADERLSDSEERAREAGAPAVPPSVGASTASAAGESRASDRSTVYASSTADRISPITDSQVVPDGLKGADFGPRFIATIIDAIIVFVLGWFARSILSIIIPSSFDDSRILGLRFFTGLVVTYFYYGHFYSTKAASPGKLLLGLEVYDVDGHTKLSYGRAFLRESLGKFISSVPLLMGYVIVLIREDRRALHDLLFDTRVIKTP